jgi:hypothetical protein
MGYRGRLPISSDWVLIAALLFAAAGLLALLLFRALVATRCG